MSVNLYYQMQVTFHNQGKLSNTNLYLGLKIVEEIKKKTEGHLVISLLPPFFHFLFKSTDIRRKEERKNSHTTKNQALGQACSCDPSLFLYWKSILDKTISKQPSFQLSESPLSSPMIGKMPSEPSPWLPAPEVWKHLSTNLPLKDTSLLKFPWCLRECLSTIQQCLKYRLEVFQPDLYCWPLIHILWLVVESLLEYTRAFNSSFNSQICKKIPHY